MNYEDIIRMHSDRLIPLKTGLEPFGTIDDPVCAVLFDVYGTLFISSSGDIGMLTPDNSVYQSIARLCEEFAVKESPSVLIDRLIEEIEREHAEQKSVKDFPEVRIEELWKRILGFTDIENARCFALRFELLVNPVCPMPGAVDLLTDCAERGLILGLISNAQFFTPHLFSAFFGKNPESLGFSRELCIFSFEQGYAKPSEFLFRKAREALRSMHIVPEWTLYVGNDMLNDIRPAGILGFKTALFAGDRRSLRLRRDRPECSAVKPDIVITDLRQIPDRIHIRTDWRHRCT